MSDPKEKFPIVLIFHKSRYLSTQLRLKQWGIDMLRFSQPFWPFLLPLMPVRLLRLMLGNSNAVVSVWPSFVDTLSVFKSLEPFSTSMACSDVDDTLSFSILLLRSVNSTKCEACSIPPESASASFSPRG